MFVKLLDTLSDATTCNVDCSGGKCATHCAANATCDVKCEGGGCTPEPKAKPADKNKPEKADKTSKDPKEKPSSPAKTASKPEAKKEEGGKKK